MKSQYEQHCNAASLEQMNVEVLKSLKKKYLPQISGWIKSSKIIAVDYPDITACIIDLIINEHSAPALISKKENFISPSRVLKKYSLENILSRKTNYDANEAGRVWQ